MLIKSLFKAAVREFEKRDIPFAVAGGFAADLYRQDPRLTMGVDFVILVEKKAAATASEIIEALGLNSGVVRMADLAGGSMFAIKRKTTQPCMVVGRKKGEETGGGVDLLLPEIPWVEQAVHRAQDNTVDFGFGAVPTMTVEDIIIAKLYALQATDLRGKDIDDLQSICASEMELNIAYLAGQISRLELTIPEKARPLMPGLLLSLDKDFRRSRQKK